MSAADTVRKNLEAYSASKRKSLALGLQEIAQEMIEDAKNNYVPYDSESSEEHLRDTGKVSEPETTDDTVSVKAQFGGTPKTAPYAVAVHETPSKHDPPSWKNKSVNFKQGGAKYLELPFKKSLATLTSKLKSKL